MTAPLNGCSDLLVGKVTFPRATVTYRIAGNDISGYPFTISFSHPATFEAEDFLLEIEGENPVEIDLHQNISIPVTVHNFNRETDQYVFIYEEVTGFYQTFHPHNELVLGPGESDSINLTIVATTAEPGSSHTFTVNVTDGCTSHSVSKTITVRLPVRFFELIIDRIWHGTSILILACQDSK